MLTMVPSALVTAQNCCVVDDEKVRRYVVGTLVELNYRVIEARGQRRVQPLWTNHDLLPTDVVMPGKNWRILSEELVRRNPELKVLFMTGCSRDAIVHDGRLDAGISLLQKPVFQRDLARRIRALLRVPAERQPPSQT
jgi:two-component system, NtrC family, sensor kinase